VDELREQLAQVRQRLAEVDEARLAALAESAGASARVADAAARLGAAVAAAEADRGELTRARRRTADLDAQVSNLAAALAGLAEPARPNGAL
jgi:hypothetical protein